MKVRQVTVFNTTTVVYSINPFLSTPYSLLNRLPTSLRVEAVFTTFKPFYFNWFLGVYNHLRNYSDTIIKGLAMAGIKDELVMQLPLEDIHLLILMPKCY